MMKRFCTIALLFLSIVAFSQETLKARTSPLAMVTAKYKTTYLKITYSQPLRKGREIFGKLIPYEKVWETGANETTEITITRDIKINGTLLKAGTYSLFTIPGENSWTIIINSDVGLWGSYNYSPSADVLRFDVPVIPVADIVYEPFTIWIDQKNDKAQLMMAWDRIKLAINIQFLEPKP